MVERTQLYCDMDNTPGAERHTLALDGPPKEIDLSEEHYQEIKEILDPYLAKAREIEPEIEPEEELPAAVPPAPHKARSRKLSRPAEPVQPPTSSNGNGNGNGEAPAGGKLDNAAVRTWAGQQSPPIEVSARGRIPQAVIEQYLAEHGAEAVPAATPRARRSVTAKASTKPRRGKVRPSPEEIVATMKQAGSFTALGEALGVSANTAATWFREAQEVLDPVS